MDDSYEWIVQDNDTYVAENQEVFSTVCNFYYVRHDI